MAIHRFYDKAAKWHRAHGEYTVRRFLFGTNPDVPAFKVQVFTNDLLQDPY